MPRVPCCGASDEASCVRARAMTDRWPFMVRSSARMSLTFADPCSELEGTAWAAAGREASCGALSSTGAAWWLSSWEGGGGALLLRFTLSKEHVPTGG